MRCYLFVIFYLKVVLFQIPRYNFLFGGAALINQCNNSHILQSKSSLLMERKFFRGGGGARPPPPASRSLYCLKQPGRRPRYIRLALPSRSFDFLAPLGFWERRNGETQYLNCIRFVVLVLADPKLIDSSR